MNHFGGKNIIAYLHELSQNKFSKKKFFHFFSDDVINPTPSLLLYPKSSLFFLNG